MDRKEPTRPRGDEKPKKTESPDRAVAPPIEPEHETAAGVFEDDEQHERDKK